jgi:hypothetical protein
MILQAAQPGAHSDQYFWRKSVLSNAVCCGVGVAASDFPIAHLTRF